MKTLLKKTKRTLYIDDGVLNHAPRGTTKKKLTFFKLDKWVTNDELQTEYEKRNLKPATIEMLVNYDLKNPQEMDKMKYVGTHWKDANGKWCYAAFGRWSDGERGVRVFRGDGVWVDFWLFAGLESSSLSSNTQSSPESLSTLTLEQRVAELEKLAEKIKGGFIV